MPGAVGSKAGAKYSWKWSVLRRRRGAGMAWVGGCAVVGVRIRGLAVRNNMVQVQYSTVQYIQYLPYCNTVPVPVPYVVSRQPGAAVFRKQTRLRCGARFYWARFRAWRLGACEAAKGGPGTGRKVPVT